MATKNDIRDKLLETKKETEILKAQLQNIIDTGRNIIDSGFQSGLSRIVQSPDDAENVNKTSPNKVQIIKSFDINQSKPLNKSPTSKTIPTNKNEPAKKVRSYNPEEAREYIKKQREKRMQQHKIQENEKLKAELQKKKLEELHKKSKELVSKNVQAKRERSNSRDRNIYLRPDEHVSKPERLRSLSRGDRSNSRDRKNCLRPDDHVSKPERLRSLSREQENKGAVPKRKTALSSINVEPRNPNLLYPPVPDYVERLRNIETERSRARDRRGSVKKCEKENSSPNEQVTSTKTTEKLDQNSIVDHQKSNCIKVLSNITLRPPNQDSLGSKSFNTEKNYSSKEGGEATTVDHRHYRKIETQQDKTGDTDPPKSLKPVKLFNTETNSPTTNTEQPTKECPSWLLDQPPQGYPYNFINTVKRQLQHATKTPKHSVDVAIQSSLAEIKTPQQLREIVEASASKKSYKCLSLDPRKLEHLELVPNGFVGGKSETGSESDTSKNIPEISSESGTSLKKNAESVRRNCNPAINTERLDSMKLVTNIKSATTTIRSETAEKHPESASAVPVDDYESDYQTDLSRSRASIISSNSPSYEKQVVVLSPQYTPSKSRQSIISSNSPSYNEQIILLSPQHVPQVVASKSSSAEATSSLSKELQTLNIPVAKSTPKEDLSSPKVQNGSITTERHSSNIPNTISTRDSSKSQTRSSPVFNSLLTSSIPSKTSTEEASQSKNDTPEVAKSREEDKNDSRNMLIKNVSVRSNRTETAALNTTNELHLKFEAEIHLLNDFNASLQQFAAVEKALESLKSRNDLTTKTLENRDTQTSAIANKSVSETSVSEVATINYSRGSFIDTDKNSSDFLDVPTLEAEQSSALSLVDLSTQSNSVVRPVDEVNFESIQANNFAGMSLNMFEQLIKDEDARLENLKAILRIREQVLLDRTKGELAWLEIQRKHFKETGQLQEASVIKKKQRGILVNHQKEKHEMQRLKQGQKAASIQRKTVLKEQSNMIRQQLSTDNMLKKMKLNTPRERRLSGPLKVIQRQTESIRSETSVSKRSSNDPDRCQEVLSVMSHLSSVSREMSVAEVSLKDVGSEVDSTHQLSHVKRTLLTREAALKKRQKVVDELLRWHQKLLEEEKRITLLETTAKTIISKPCSREKYSFEGAQLNQLWLSLTGCETSKFSQGKIYPMSQLALERFCKNAREFSVKVPVKSGGDKSVLSENNPGTETGSLRTEYASDFDVESVLSEEEVEIFDQSISQLISNFSKIKEDISALSSKQSKKTDEDESVESAAEISVIETNKDNFSQLEIETDRGENVVAENLNDSQEILLMLGGEDAVSKSRNISSDLSPAEKEELGREVRNSLSATENILSMLSQAISDVQEIRSGEKEIKEGIDTIDDAIEDIQSSKDAERSLSKEATLFSGENKDSSVVEEEAKNIAENFEHSGEPTKDSEKHEELFSTLENNASFEDPSIPSGEIINTDESCEENKAIEPAPSEKNSLVTDQIHPAKEANSSSESLEQLLKISEVAPVNGFEEVSIIDLTPEESPNKTSPENSPKDTRADEDISTDTEPEAAVNSQKTEEIYSSSELDLSYGIIDKAEVSESKEEVYEEKEQDSLSSEGGNQEKSPVNVKKRVSEILADATQGSRGDKSPRMQDLYVTTYDLISPANSPETGSPTLGSSFFGSEAEEILRKQLAIEQEIKAITEQQQKEQQLPHAYVREIPNKPPPPYTPPSSLPPINYPTIVPTVQEIEEITKYSAKILHKAHVSKNLDNIVISDNTLSLISKDVTKECYKFVFDLCKDIARQHYGQFREEKVPSWLVPQKRVRLAVVEPLDVHGLEGFLNKKLKELFGYDKPVGRENAIIKWSRKKRDHIDEILVMEAQAEEAQWTNYDKEELRVLDEVTREIFDVLLMDTVGALKGCFGARFITQS